MECNKEVALIVKEMAEKKLMERDIGGAKRLAMKAQLLNPGLDGLSQFLATLDVYISSEDRTYGETDWYRVLGVEPLADDDTIHKHYLKLVLILHPDKNKSVGAEGAFKIVSEAWGLLSDKAQRSAYDQRRSSSHLYQEVPSYGSSLSTSQNGFHDFFSNNKFNSTTQKSAMDPKPAPPPHFSKPETFWTICNFCKTQFEYLTTYLKTSLLCQNCRQPFFAVEMPPPPINGNGPSTKWAPFMRGRNSTEHTRSKYSCTPRKKPISNTNVRPAANSGSFVRVGTIGGVPLEAPKADIREESIQRKVHTFKEAGGGLAIGSSDAGFVSTPTGDRLMKKRRIDVYRRNYLLYQMPNRNIGVGDSGTLKGSFETGRRNTAGSYKFNQMRELSQLELRKILMEKAKKDIRLKLESRRIPPAVSKTSEKEMEKEKGKQKVSPDGTKTDGNSSEVVNSETRAQPESFLANLDDDPDGKVPDPISMTVPDPDFHDFDKDRTEKSFGDNQVWAAYDDDDGMPRYYAIIHSVMSLRPFRMRISWLNSKSNRELSPLNWIGSGFSKTNGDFWIGKHEVNKSLNSFSHKVKWVKGTRGTIQIYPRKGDVWALYCNWSPDWNELTPDEVIHKYDMVEVLENYSEARGVIVAPLVKVAGFKTVFRRHPDSCKTKAIPREELFRFSHQVPSYWLPGQEGHDAPRGCWELDPASMPLELLKVLTGVQVEEMIENAEKAKDPLGDGKKSKVAVMENGETAKGKDVVGNAAKEDTAEVKKDKGKETKFDGLIVYKRRREKN